MEVTGKMFKPTLGWLIKRAQGNLSGKEYAARAKISQPALTRIKRDEYKPSPEVLERLAKAAEDPDEVSYEDLLDAAGFRTQAERAATKMESEERLDRETSVDMEMIRNLRRQAIRRYKECEAMVEPVIYTALVEKGIAFKKKENAAAGKKGDIRHYDLVLEPINQPITNWVFELKPRAGSVVACKMSLTCLFDEAFSEEKKFTFVVNDEDMFRKYQKYERLLPIRGEVSVALFNEENRKFVKEIYLSNYYEGDRSREVYLV